MGHNSTRLAGTDRAGRVPSGRGWWAWSQRRWVHRGGVQPWSRRARGSGGWPGWGCVRWGGCRDLAQRVGRRPGRWRRRPGSGPRGRRASGAQFEFAGAEGAVGVERRGATTTTLRSPRWPVRRRVGSRASAASEAMRTSPSAQLTRRAPSGGARASGSAGLVVGVEVVAGREELSASRPAGDPQAEHGAFVGGEASSPRSQPSWRSRRRNDPLGFGAGGRSVPSGCWGRERNSRSSWAVDRGGRQGSEPRRPRATGTRRASAQP